MNTELTKMNLIAIVQQLPEEDIEVVETYIKTIEKENERLKKQLNKYENPEDMTLMMMWCTEKVKDENEKLKRQIEDANEKILLLQASEPMLNYKKALEETQQKEFINYLEDKIYTIEPKGTSINYNCEYDSEEDYVRAMQEQSRLNILKESLQKYISIIGVKNGKEG